MMLSGVSSISENTRKISFNLVFVLVLVVKSKAVQSAQPKERLATVGTVMHCSVELVVRENIIQKFKVR